MNMQTIATAWAGRIIRFIISVVGLFALIFFTIMVITEMTESPFRRIATRWMLLCWGVYFLYWLVTTLYVRFIRGIFEFDGGLPSWQKPQSWLKMILIDCALPLFIILVPGGFPSLSPVLRIFFGLSYAAYNLYNIYYNRLLIYTHGLCLPNLFLPWGQIKSYQWSGQILVVQAHPPTFLPAVSFVNTERKEETEALLVQHLGAGTESQEAS